MKYYFLHKGTESMISYLDIQGADYLSKQGWTLGDRPYDTREEAVEAKTQWEAILRKTSMPPK